MSQRIRFARVASHVDDFNTRNKVFTAKLSTSNNCIDIINFIAFLKFYRRHSDLVSEYNVGLKTILLQDVSEPEFYGNLMY